MTAVPPACFRDPETPAEALLTWAQCPPEWLPPVLYLSIFAVVGVVAYRLRQGVPTDRIVAAALNAWAFLWTVGGAWLAVYGAGLGPRGGVGAGAAGAVGFLLTRDWAAEQFRAVARAG